MKHKKYFTGFVPWEGIEKFWHIIILCFDQNDVWSLYASLYWWGLKFCIKSNLYVYVCVCIRVLYWNACYLKNIHISLIVFYFCQIWFKYPTFVILTNLLFTDNYISLNTLFLFHLNINFYLPKYNYFSPSFCNLTRVVHGLVQVDFGFNLTKLGGKLEGPLLTERMTNGSDQVELATGWVSKDLLRSRGDLTRLVEISSNLEEFLSNRLRSPQIFEFDYK